MQTNSTSRINIKPQEEINVSPQRMQSMLKQPTIIKHRFNSEKQLQSPEQPMTNNNLSTKIQQESSIKYENNFE